MAQKVFVSGCFDMLHSGHMAFLKTAASFGELYVGVASDKTLFLLKNKTPVNPQEERLFMVKGVQYVKDAWISSGAGMLDFEEDIQRLQPDIFIVNEDGHTAEKAALCARLNIDYKVLPRLPERGLPARFSSILRNTDLPYRAELCGAWLDQPFINTNQAGYVICAQLEPNEVFAAHCGGGLATSTRACLEKLREVGVRGVEKEALARLAFRLENGIDQQQHPVSGAQDALGLCMPGVSFQYYNNGYWPTKISTLTQAEPLAWLEEHLSLYPLSPRDADFNPLKEKNLTKEAMKALAESSNLCKAAIENQNIEKLSSSFTLCREAQKELLPSMYPKSALDEIKSISPYMKNWKFTGAGGGGWVILLDAKGLQGTVPFKISANNYDEENML